MGVYTFVCRTSGDGWTAKQLSGDLEASADSTYDLQRKLVKVTSSDGESLQSSFSLVSPTSAVFQVIVGGGVAAYGGGGGGSPAAADQVTEAPKEEEKPEKEESDDEPLFDIFGDDA